MQRITQQAGIVCCSDGLAKNQQEQVHNLRDALRQMNISVIMSPYLYQGIGTAKQKAQALMALYGNDDIHDVFDISGGDLANKLLPLCRYPVGDIYTVRAGGWHRCSSDLVAAFCEKRSSDCENKTDWSRGRFQGHSDREEHVFICSKMI